MFRLGIHIGESPFLVEHDERIANTFEDIGDALIGLAKFALRLLPGEENGLGILPCHRSQLHLLVFVCWH